MEPRTVPHFLPALFAFSLLDNRQNGVHGKRLNRMTNLRLSRLDPFTEITIFYFQMYVIFFLLFFFIFDWYFFFFDTEKCKKGFTKKN